MKLPRRRRPEFEEFAAAHGPDLVRLAFAVCGDRERAQDACQETLMRVYQRWARINDPVAYARRTVIHATYEDRNRDLRRDRVQQAMGAAARISDHPQEQVPERAALMSALDSLHHDLRAVVVLRYGRQLSENETARTLDIPIGTVKSRTARALARLREQLETQPTPAPEEAPCA